MKRQYLGDAKDAFKWDYLDFLTRKLKIPLLNILLMLTPPDKTTHGKKDPYLFPAPCIWPFCEELREKRDFGLLHNLPNCGISAGRGDSQYEVHLHKGESHFYNSAPQRVEYFSDITRDTAQVLFADPDVGFAPPSGGNDKHILFSDVDKALGEISKESIVAVFQHSRRIFTPFSKHYAEILENLPLTDSQSSTAVCWHNEAMLVILGKPAQIKKVRKINHEYQKLPRPAQVLD